MRRFLRVCLVLATLWCLWWFGASAALRLGLESWLDARRLEGWQAETSKIEGGGFPVTLVADLRDPRFADPRTGVAISTDTLRVEADAWWPGQARVLLPDTPIRFAAPDGQAQLQMQNGAMRMDLAPKSQLELRQLAWTSGPWLLSGPEGSQFSAKNLTASMVQTDAPETYVFDISLDAAQPGEVPRARLLIPDKWPLTFDNLQIDMTVAFDRPWDRSAIEETRPQPRRIELKLAEAVWGDLRLKLAADLQVDEIGIPTGDIQLQAQNWQAMVTLAENAGVLPSNLRPQVTSVLSTLASASGNANTIDVTLKAQRGLLFLGFIPVGQAPTLQLR